MSSLIKSELFIFMVMSGCGMAAGLIGELFKSYIAVRKPGRFGNIVTQLGMYAVSGVLISEFFYYCDNGKITATGIGSFLIGLWLWKTFFCGILTLTEAENGENGEDGEEERRSKDI